MGEDSIENTKRIRKAAQHINNAFDWAASREGSQYWDQVVTNLLDLIGEEWKVSMNTELGKTKKRVRKAQAIIVWDIPWHLTQQGVKYWSDVYDNLQRIRDNAK